MTGWLVDLGTSGTVLALLGLGHVIGDYLFQTDALVARKEEIAYLVLHGGLVAVAHLLALIPFLSGQVVLAVLVIAATHLAIDAGKLWATDRWGKPLGLFTLDQALHGVVLVAIWAWLTSSATAPVPWVPGIGVLGPEALAWITKGAVLASVVAFNHKGANAVVRMVLPEAEALGDREDELQAGRLIGTLERWLVLILALVSQWSAIALVIAAKSIARFEELKDQAFAEYYLVGTLTSVLLAVVSAFAVQVLI